jgi:hypothetical protein
MSCFEVYGPSPFECGRMGQGMGQGMIRLTIQLNRLRERTVMTDDAPQALFGLF